jgi:hypothetical protein
VARSAARSFWSNQFWRTGYRTPSDGGWVSADAPGIARFAVTGAGATMLRALGVPSVKDVVGMPTLPVANSGTNRSLAPPPASSKSVPPCEQLTVVL